jgi:oligopeptide transport system substrate-binding protein
MTPARFTRRQFVGRSAAAIGALTLSDLLAAYGGTAFASAGSRSASSPVRGGAFSFSHEGTPPGYDPQKWWNAQAGVAAAVVSEPLIAIDNYSGKRIPKLAVAEPHQSADGTVYTFKLRPGVKFHGGHGTLTAEDVKFSWERVMSPGLASEAGSLYTSIAFHGLADFLKGKAKHIRGLRAVDDLTFEVTLDHGDSAFLPTFTYQQAAIVPAGYYAGKTLKEVNWKPVGTGPYLLESANPASGAKLIRNPDYWDKGRPYLDSVNITYNVDPQLAVLRILKGQQDMMLESIPAASIALMQGNPQYKPYYNEGQQDDCQWLSLPSKMKPFTDVRVRQAIAMAIDKEKLVKILKGLGTPAGGTFFSPLSPYYQANVALPFDPKKAKGLLAAAGYPSGFSAPFWYQNQPPFSDYGPAIVQDLANIGITAHARPMEYNQFVGATNAGPPAMITFAWEDAYRHGSYIVDSAFTSAAIKAGCCNYPKWSSPQVDALAAQGHSPSPQKSAAAYRQIAEIIVHDEALWVPLFYPKRADAVNKTVGGFEVAVYPDGEAHPFDRYWIT